MADRIFEKKLRCVQSYLGLILSKLQEFYKMSTVDGKYNTYDVDSVMGNLILNLKKN